ncbi:MAG TPA: DsbA family protein, partial [Vicinamibacteria bacterium]
ANQRSLTPELIYSLAAAHGASRAELEQCVASEATRARLDEDVALSAQYRPEGTPLVVVNGRRAVSYPGFLYAIILAKGDGQHPAFAGLPPPNPQVHAH